MGGSWRKKVTERVWPHIGQHDLSVGRMANFALGSLYGSGVGVTDLVKRATSTLYSNRGRNREIVSASTAVLCFLGDNFNNYLSEVPPQLYMEHTIPTGSEPSALLKEALTHKDEKYNGGIKFPETLDLLEQAGIISKQDFFKFANLQAKCDQEIAKLATELGEATDKEERSAIRLKMVEINCDSVGAILCAFTHMFKPNPEISAKEDLTCKDLRELYPMQMDIGHAWQYSYGALACLNRITREQLGEIAPDPIIVELERMGAYTPEFIEEICKVVHNHPKANVIPMSDLPKPLQTAIRSVGEQAEALIKTMPHAGRVRKAIYSGINTLNAGIAVCNKEASRYFPSSPEHSGCAR